MEIKVEQNIEVFKLFCEIWLKAQERQVVITHRWTRHPDQLMLDPQLVPRSSESQLTLFTKKALEVNKRRLNYFLVPQDACSFSHEAYILQVERTEVYDEEMWLKQKENFVSN